MNDESYWCSIWQFCQSRYRSSMLSLIWEKIFPNGIAIIVSVYPFELEILVLDCRTRNKLVLVVTYGIFFMDALTNPSLGLLKTFQIGSNRFFLDFFLILRHFLCQVFLAIVFRTHFFDKSLNFLFGFNLGVCHVAGWKSRMAQPQTFHTITFFFSQFRVINDSAQVLFSSII